MVLSPGLLVQDDMLTGARLMMVDTQKCSNHMDVLSTQAIEILTVHCKGKKPDAKVFDVLDPGNTLEAVNNSAGVEGVTLISCAIPSPAWLKSWSAGTL